MAKRLVYRFSKTEFFKLIGYEPHPGQALVHASTAPRRVVACGVRWGKSLCAAGEALAAAMEPRERGVGWVVAPTYELAERVFQTVAITAMEKLHHRVVKCRAHEQYLALRNISGGITEIRGKSADNPVSLLGEGLDFLVVDEASRLKASIWEGHLSQRLIDKHGWALLISTPRGRGWYFDAWRRGQGRDPAYASWNLPSAANPLLDEELIEAERLRLPERVFKQEYLAEFLDGSGSVFRNVRELATGSWQEPKPGERYAAGLDLAKTEDFSVLTIVNGRREVVFQDRFHRLDWGLQVQRIKASLDRYGRASVLVDTTGAGEPVYEALCRAGIRAEAYPFTQKSKAVLIDNLSLLFEQRKLVLPRVELAPDLIDELESFEYSVTDAGNTRMGAPSGVHDDTVISLALAAWHLRTGASRPGFYALDMPSGPGRRVRLRPILRALP